MEQFNAKLTEAQSLFGGLRPGLMSIKKFDIPSSAPSLDGSVDIAYADLYARADFAGAELAAWEPDKNALTNFIKENLGDSHAVVPRKHLIVTAMLALLTMFGISWAGIWVGVRSSSVAQAASEAAKYRDSARVASEVAQRHATAASITPQAIDGLRRELAGLAAAFRLSCVNLEELATGRQTGGDAPRWGQMTGSASFVVNLHNYTASAVQSMERLDAMGREIPAE